MVAAASTAELRIRLEGRLEALEWAVATVNRLLGLAHEGWEEHPVAVLEAVDLWARAAADRTAARLAATREQRAQPWLDELAAAELRLVEKLDEVLEETAAPRRRTLDEKLSTWGELARSLGPHPEQHEPLAQGEGVVRSREWTVTIFAALTVTLLKQPLLALLLAPIGVVWWDFCKTVVRWRMFKDSLEISEPDRPVRRVPLSSIEELDPDHLRGLWDLSLRGESGFLELAVDVRRALTERATRARYAGSSEAALWIPASLHTGEPPRAQHGWVLSCERGLVFIPDTAISLAWYLVMGAPPQETPDDLGAELRALPAKLFEDKVADLSRAKFCLNLGRLGHEAFQSLGEILLVLARPDRKLFLSCPLTLQAKLLERVHPQR